MIQHPGFTWCVPCQYAHEEALQSLGTGTPPKECSECGTAWSELRLLGHDRMACHMENGRYRMLCMRCDADYVPKRKELYGPTEYGFKNGLAN